MFEIVSYRLVYIRTVDKPHGILKNTIAATMDLYGKLHIENSTNKIIAMYDDIELARRAIKIFENDHSD